MPNATSTKVSQIDLTKTHLLISGSIDKDKTNFLIQTICSLLEDRNTDFLLIKNCFLPSPQLMHADSVFV